MTQTNYTKFRFRVSRNKALLEHGRSDIWVFLSYKQQGWTDGARGLWPLSLKIFILSSFQSKSAEPWPGTHRDSSVDGNSYQACLECFPDLSLLLTFAKLFDLFSLSHIKVIYICYNRLKKGAVYVGSSS